MELINELKSGRITFLAVTFFLLALALFEPVEARAQWTSGSGTTTTPDKVGVGTSNPTNGKLEVTADDGVTSGEHSLLFGSRSGAGSAGFKFGYRADGTSATGGFVKGLGNLSFFLGTEGTPQALTIKNAGNVGVGTTSPGSVNGLDFSNSVLLHVKGGTSGTFIMADGAATGTGFAINDSSQAANNRMWGISQAVGAGRLSFSTITDTGTFTHMMVIDRTGNVGIGTTNPAYRLDVTGQVRSSSGGFVFPDGTTQTTAFTSQNIFKNVGNAAGATQFSAGSNTDTLRFEGTGGTTVSFDAANKKVVINSSSGSSSGWTDAGTSVNLTSTTAKVGMGTSDPSFGGTTASKLSIAQADGITSLTVGNASGLPRFALNGNSTGSWTMYDYGTGAWAAGITQNGGRVGIGTNSPLQKLQIGSNTPALTNTPDALSLGATYSGVAGANPKLRLWDDTTNVYGLGVSAQQFDFMAPATARYVWNFNGVEKMRLDSSGNVGIGTTPGANYKLDVNGDTHVTGAINASGAITGATINATYQDVAEWVPSTRKLSAGTVVVLDSEKTNHVLASISAYDTKVAGVISDSPGVILGEGGEGKLKVATTGRVKVKVDATRAAIKVGDLLVTSEVEGVAMKSVEVDLGGVKMHRPGTIIGKALEPLASGTGEILVLLSLQ